MSDRDGKHVGVFGKTGSGKSALTFEWTREAERLFVFDPKGSWAKQPGFEVLKHFSQVKPFLDDMGDGAFKVVYTPEALKAPKRLSTLSLMLMDLQEPYFWGRKHKKLTLVADELADGFPLSLPSGVPGFAELCQKGREYGVNVVGITQRPASVHPAFRGNLTRIASFNFSFVNDRKAVALAMEDEAVMDALTGLGLYEYLLFENGNWDKCAPIAVP